MDISLLPEEIFSKIALHLELEDLLACCLVNSSWRNAVNQNEIWYPLCSRRSLLPRDKSELLSKPCQVKPAFRYPEQTCDTLTKLCNWRKRFMQEAHLSRNWRFGRYASESITKHHSPRVIECDDNVIIIANLERQEFTVYNFEKNPVEEVQTTPYSLWHVSSDFLKLEQNKLVIVQCTLLQVFSKTPENMFELSYRVLFNKSPEDSHQIPTTRDVSDWYKNNIGLYPCDIVATCDHNGKYFLGLILEGNLNKAKFHIWNLLTGEKSSEPVVPETEARIIDMHFSFHKNNLYMLMKLHDSFKEYTEIYCFCLEMFKFTNLILTFDYVVPVLLFSDNFVFNTETSGRSLLLWRNESGAFAHKMNCDFEINPMTLQCVSDSVILAGSSGYCSIVKVFNIKTFETTCEFVADYKVTMLYSIRSKMILAGGCMRLALWDIETATKLYTLQYDDCIWTNVNNTKLLVASEEELYALHFW